MSRAGDPAARLRQGEARKNPGEETAMRARWAVLVALVVCTVASVAWATGQMEGKSRFLVVTTENVAAPRNDNGNAIAEEQGAQAGQDPQSVWGSRDRITFRCESNDGRWRECPADLRGRLDVRLVRQLSDRQCIEGRTWGWDRNSVWVNEGCRAEFEVYRRTGWDDDTYIRCESSDGRRRYCRADLDGRSDVELARQLSNAVCREGSTWGWDRNGVWVDRGCRGEFKIDRRSGGWDDNYLRCESNDGRRQYCGTGFGGGSRFDVRLAKQLSNAPCVERRTWGVDNRGLWVDNGCRGEFEIDRRGSGGGYPPGKGPGKGGGFGGDTDRVVRCESSDGRRHSCPIGERVRRVALTRQLSSAVCREGQTWGWNEREIWVDRGCRGEFAIDRDRGRR